MKTTAVVLLSCPALLPRTVDAWIPKQAFSHHAALHFERISTCPSLLTTNAAKKDNDGEDFEEKSLIEAYRASLESSYLMYGDGVFDDTEGDHFVRIHESFANDPVRAYSMDTIDDSEDCEQCKIPDEFKLHSKNQSIDVMSFLGIRRAEPLRVEQKRDYRAWE